MCELGNVGLLYFKLSETGEIIQMAVNSSLPVFNHESSDRDAYL